MTKAPTRRWWPEMDDGTWLTAGYRADRRLMRWTLVGCSTATCEAGTMGPWLVYGGNHDNYECAKCGVAMWIEAAS